MGKVSKFAWTYKIITISTKSIKNGVKIAKLCEIKLKIAKICKNWAKFTKCQTKKNSIIAKEWSKICKVIQIKRKLKNYVKMEQNLWNHVKKHDK